MAQKFQKTGMAAQFTYRGQTDLLQNMELPKNLTTTYKKIIQARCEGASFCEMAEEELTWSSDQIIMRGSALYGSKIPDSDFLGTFISEEIITFINDFGYTELTLAEILLAMRMNTKSDIRWEAGDNIAQVAFTGEYFNINFLSAILSTYSRLRMIVDRKIQNKIDGYE